MNRFTLIFADDEQASRDGLRELLLRDESIDVLAACENGLEAIEAIDTHHPDIILLDIQMPEVNGFDVLRSITAPLPQVIFVTAFDQFAIKAFENHVLDYLLKPFSDERFYSAIARAKEHVSLKRDLEDSKKVNQLLNQIKAEDEDRIIGGSNTNRTRQKLIVKTSGKIVMIPWEAIQYVEADDYVIRIVYADKVAVVRESMKHLEQILPSDKFIRTHKSFIVHTEKIVEVENNYSGGMVLHLPDKVAIPVGKTYRSSVITALQLPL